MSCVAILSELWKYVLHGPISIQRLRPTYRYSCRTGNTIHFNENGSIDTLSDALFGEQKNSSNTITDSEYVICNETRSKVCQGQIILSKNYIDHLKNSHEIIYESRINRKQCRFFQIPNNIEKGDFINTDYFNHDGKTFMIKWEKEMGVYYTWLCVLDSTEEELKKYTGEITMKSKKVASMTWKVSVHTAQKTLAEIQSTGAYATIPEDQLYRFTSHTKTELPDKPSKSYWEIRCTIFGGGAQPRPWQDFLYSNDTDVDDAESAGYVIHIVHIPDPGVTLNKTKAIAVRNRHNFTGIFPDHQRSPVGWSLSP